MEPPLLDRADLGRLYQQYGGVVFRLARRLLTDEATARDVCHDVFIEIMRTRPAWSPPSPMGWLYTTTTNKCLNLLRHQRRSQQALERAASTALSAPPGLPVGLLLGALPIELQEIAVYYGINQMKQEEIALVLGVSQKTVSNRIQEIRALLCDAETDCAAEAT